MAPAANKPTNPPSQAAIDRAIEAGAKAQTENGHVSDTWESKARPGLVFRLFPVSNYAVVAARNNLTRPKVPVVWIADKERSEENPNHPDYLDAVQTYRLAQSVATVDTYVAMGTAIKEAPPSVDPVEGTDWVEQLEASGLEVPTKKYARYVAWVKWYALAQDEVGDLMVAVQRFNGNVPESDADDATDELKSDEGKHTDSEASPAQESS